jgi:2-keto-4-pentenoate hydratase/2-oxohepta-3-ene-1,7-dioic acid hydratase in catechol pathway
LIAHDGTLRDLPSFVIDIFSKTLTSQRLDQLRQLDHQSLPMVAGNPRIVAPIADIGKRVCVGLNYIDHAMEAEMSTLAGVGMGQTPPIYLTPGDLVELGIEGLGTQRQRALAHFITKRD